jgi:phytoene dehydrogenase-like protein
MSSIRTSGFERNQRVDSGPASRPHRVHAYDRARVKSYDAVVVGAGSNGLAAAVVLAEAGQSVLVLERENTIGGGCRTAQITLPGFHHDLCSAIHPMAVVSPLLRRLPLERFGLKWVQAPAPLAHPFDDGAAAVLYRSLAATAATLGRDGDAWIALVQPLLHDTGALFADILRPLRFPRHPMTMARFGVHGLRSCASLIRTRFRDARARGLFAGCAAHSFLPLDAAASASFGLVLALVGHATDWPCAEGGSQRIVDALAAYLRSLGGHIALEHDVQFHARYPAGACGPVRPRPACAGAHCGA